MKEWFRENRGPFGLLFLCSCVFALVFALYDLPLEAVIYPSLLCAGILVLSGVRRQILIRRKLRALKTLTALPDNLPQRLEAFEQAVRQVYASTMDISALEYRRVRGLDKKDEQMAILVQRVSGSYYGKYFMPCAAF